MDPFPVLRSPRLMLRRLRTADAKNVWDLFSHPEVARYRDEQINGIADARRVIATAAEFFNAGVGICWGLALEDPGPVVGSCTIAWSPANRSAHLGYDLSPVFWVRGLMSEAVEMVLGYAFETVVVNRVQAITRLDNERSISLLRSAGFLKEGVLREFALTHDGYHDMRCFSLLRSEWLERRAAIRQIGRQFIPPRFEDGAPERA